MRRRAALVFGCALACVSCGGTKHELTVPKVFPVPNVVGFPHGVALDRLEAAGLCVGTIKFATDGPTDEVVAQSPSGGTEVAPRAAVTLTLGPGGPNGTIYSDQLGGCPDQPRYIIPSEFTRSP
jgi:hypothetical protein